MSPGRSAIHVPLRAALTIVAATGCFALSDAIVKYLTQRYPVPLLIFVRFGMQALVTVAWFGPRMRWDLVRTPQPTLQIIRGAVLLGSALFFFNALRWLPLAAATAINYTTPIVVVLLSVALLGERMTPSRWAFVAAGFVGMLLIVRPGASIFHEAALLALGAAGCYAIYQILTRRLAGDDPRVTLFYPAIVGTALMLLLLPFLDYRAAMTWPHVALVVVFGSVATLGHFLFIRAFRDAPASALTPFTYAQIVWAVLLGLVFYGYFPDAYSLAGIAIIAASGLLLAWHERRRARALVAIEDPTVVD